MMDKPVSPVRRYVLFLYVLSSDDSENDVLKEDRMSSFC